MHNGSRPRFGVTAKMVDAAYVIRVQGELDVTTAPEVHRALGSAITLPTKMVILDLCGVRFLDSTGLQALIQAQRRLTGLRRGFVVACPDGPVRRALEIANLIASFRVAPDVQAALAA
jgi:anti-anti-sigma factor